MFCRRFSELREYSEVEEHIRNHIHGDCRFDAFGQCELHQPHSGIGNDCVEARKGYSDALSECEYRLITGEIKLPNLDRRFLAINIAGDDIFGRVASLKAATSEDECCDVETNSVAFESG